MGWKFRRSIRLAKGVRLNFGKNGFTSVSIGGKGFTVNVGEKGIKKTISLPGTGISYSEYEKYNDSKISREVYNNVNYYDIPMRKFLRYVLYLWLCVLVSFYQIIAIAKLNHLKDSPLISWVNFIFTILALVCLLGTVTATKNIKFWIISILLSIVILPVHFFSFKDFDKMNGMIHMHRTGTHTKGSIKTDIKAINEIIIDKQNGYDYWNHLE